MKCISARSPRKERGIPQRQSCRISADTGITVIEVMPVAEFPGQIRLGLRRRQSVRARSHLYGSPTTCARSSTDAHALRDRRHPGCRLQPSRTGRQLSGRVLAGISAISTRPTGVTAINFDGERLRTGPRVLPGQRRVTGSRSFISTDCVWMRRRTFYDDSDDHISLRNRPAARKAAETASRSFWWRKTNRKKRSWSARTKKAATGSMRLWNDDFHHSAHGRPDRAQRCLLHGLSRHAAGVHLGVQIRLSLSGAMVQWQKQAAGNADARAVPPSAFVTFIENHDQIANSRARARAHRS